ncbi:TetR/AcrR family transcriptional regulator [Virgisporangium ochraceum]
MVFPREGHASTTTDQVAALAEVTKRTIYRHFADKPTPRS